MSSTNANDTLNVSYDTYRIYVVKQIVKEKSYFYGSDNENKYCRMRSDGASTQVLASATEKIFREEKRACVSIYNS